jgi:hypothetical protein
VTVPVAHAGHWLVNLIYLAPVLIIGGALGVQVWRDRRRGPDEDDDVSPT